MKYFLGLWSILFLTSCTSYRTAQSPKMTILDPSAADSLGGTGTSSGDVRSMAEKMAREIVGIRWPMQGQTPQIAVVPLKNVTHFRVDPKLLQNKLVRDLVVFARGRVVFLARDTEAAVMAERARKRAGLYSSGQVTRAMAGADYLLTGEISFYGPDLPYNLVILPPSNSANEALVLADKNLSDTNGPYEITLKIRAHLEGVVTNHAGEPVLGAHINLTRLSDDGLFHKVTRNLSPIVDAITNKKGELCSNISNDPEKKCGKIWLDPARYRLTITPPAGKPLPLYNLEIDFPKNNQLVVTMPKPKILEGIILSSSRKEPINKAFIRIFDQENKIFLGNAITEANGRFKAYIRSDLIP